MVSGFGDKSLTHSGANDGGIPNRVGPRRRLSPRPKADGGAYEDAARRSRRIRKPLEQKTAESLYLGATHLSSRPAPGDSHVPTDYCSIFVNPSWTMYIRPAGVIAKGSLK